MEKSRDLASEEYASARSASADFAVRPGLTLDSDGTRALEAWFLGPKAENADVLERLVVEAIRDHAFWRRNFHPADPTHIPGAVKRTAEYLAALDTLQDGFRGLLAALKKSVPFFSPRYQGHMNWDLTIPSMLGYFSAMLYNPNNVAFEGSTATTSAGCSVTRSPRAAIVSGRGATSLATGPSPISMRVLLAKPALVGL
jgi:hypothetical protein